MNCNQLQKLFLIQYQTMMINNQIKLLKTLVIEEQKTQKTHIISVDIPLIDSCIYFQQVIKEKLPQLVNKIIKTYDFFSNQYINLSKQLYRLPLHCLHPSNIILFKVGPQITKTNTNISSSINSSQILEIKSDASSKKERSKERILFEVIKIVKQWREIHLNKNNFKKMSLQEAAKMIGLPKKSLDDYYYQLRLGQKYDFDFRAHLYDRIGVLRTYLKNLKDNPQLIKHQKHPKKLKILQQFQQIQEIFHANKNIYRSYGNYNEMQQEAYISQERHQMKSENIEEDDSKGIQDNFYSEFQYFLNEKDPFLACDYNFKKKSYEDNNSQQLFF